MRYTRLRTWFLLLAVVLVVILVLTYSENDRDTFQSTSPVTDSLITATYPDLYDAIVERNTEALVPYLEHENSEVRHQAWRAFANTPVDSLSQFLTLALEQNSEAAWFGISQHALNEQQLRRLENSWEDNPEYRSGIARVLGQQGDEQSLNFLLNNLNAQEFGNEYQFGLAVGRLINQYDISESDQIGVLQNAFDTKNYETTRAYLYGWYRGDESRLTSVARDTLHMRWRLLGTGISTQVDQYVNKMLKARTTSEMTIFYNGEQRLDTEAQLSVELAQSIGALDLNERNALAAKILLTNENPHVQIKTLESIRDKVSRQSDLYNYITGTMLEDSRLSDIVWIEALRTAAETDSALVEKYDDRLQSAADNNIYLLPAVLSVYGQVESSEAYLQRISDTVNEGDTLKTIYALQGLNNYWQNFADKEQTETEVEQVRDIVFSALDQRDRGIAFTARSLLQNEELFGENDFDRINNALSAFSLPDDIEVFQAFGSLYRERFQEQAKPVIDSLAAQNYAPLNRSLADAGWDVDIPERDTAKTAEFRIPNWNRLWELGRHPVWTLQTEKGTISIELNTLRAPATIAMIDSLSRAGEYDSIPFHRVVPNFVIQGGDIERQDGFGGPDFVIPTEASEQGFVRGAVGIASAGPDTEGSQYFIMHQWKPHLNGNYTLFGNVIEGKRVVDRITPGDKVLSTTWY